MTYKLLNIILFVIYSNKVWTAADVKEYTWPPPDKADVEHKVN